MNTAWVQQVDLIPHICSVSEFFRWSLFVNCGWAKMLRPWWLSGSSSSGRYLRKGYMVCCFSGMPASTLMGIILTAYTVPRTILRRVQFGQISSFNFFMTFSGRELVYAWFLRSNYYMKSVATTFCMCIWEVLRRRNLHTQPMNINWIHSHSKFLPMVLHNFFAH